MEGKFFCCCCCCCFPAFPFFSIFFRAERTSDSNSAHQNLLARKFSCRTELCSPTFASPEVSSKNLKIIKVRFPSFQVFISDFSNFCCVSRPDSVPKISQYSISVPNAPISLHFDFFVDLGPKACRKPVFDPIFRVHPPEKKSNHWYHHHS